MTTPSNNKNRIIIVTDTYVSPEQHHIARALTKQDASVPVSVFPSSELSIAEARYFNAQEDRTTGKITAIPGYTFTIQLKLGEKNQDGTNKSGRGHITLDGAVVPGALRQYAHYLEGVDSETRVVNPRHVFSETTDEQGMSRLKCDVPNRSWYSMKPCSGEDSGVYVFLLGPERPTDIEGRVQNPIERLVIADMGQFEKTVSSKRTIAAEVLSGSEWKSGASSEVQMPVKPAKPVLAEKPQPVAAQAVAAAPAFDAGSLIDGADNF